MTPAMLNRHLRARSVIDAKTSARSLTHAWWNNSLSRQKKLPPLDPLVRRLLAPLVQRDKPKQSWQDMKAIAQAWTAHLRGLKTSEGRKK